MKLNQIRTRFNMSNNRFSSKKSNRLNHRPVLLLNADFSVLVPITIKRAINLYSVGKVQFLKTKGDKVFHPSMDIVGMPVVAILNSFTRVPHREIPITRRNVLLRDNYICQYTGEKLTEKSASIDHVIPKSFKESPGNTWGNLVSCTKNINNYKADKMPDAVGLKLIRPPYKPTWQELIIKHRPEWVEFMEEVKLGKV